MFHKTRLKLTAWYLLIIMTISISFSAVFYIDATREFDRLLRIQRYRIEHPQRTIQILQMDPLQFQELVVPTTPDPQLIADAKLRMIFILLGVNGFIFVLSAIAGYFLAGRTLKPIKVMMDEQNRFITDASHELNTPLTSLRTAIEVNLRNKNLNVKDAKETLKSNLEEVERLQQLSSDLMTLAQYQEQNGTLPFTKLSLKTVISDAQNKVNTLAKEKKITFHTIVSDIFFSGNQRSLLELFIILLDNAIKYSDAQKTVTIAAFEVNEKIIITIADEGKGITAEDLPHIFDRFYRSDKSRTTQQAHGHGLGLSIAKRIVTLHNGTITATSELEKGTCFTITFPKATSI